MGEGVHDAPDPVRRFSTIAKLVQVSAQPAKLQWSVQDEQRGPRRTAS